MTICICTEGPYMKPSTLIGVRPNGTEERYCGECGTFYLLPIPYDKCNPVTRDLCTECIAKMQREHDEPVKKAEPTGPDWY
jgi:hypothetical protein